MNSLTLKYDTHQILVFISVSILCLLFFGYILFRTEDFSSMVTSGTAIHGWVGRLFFGRGGLLFIFALFFIVLFLYFLVDLLRKLKQKTWVLSQQNHRLFINGKYWVNKDSIETMEIRKMKNNYSAILTLKDPQKFLEERTTLLEKWKYKILLYLNQNNLALNLTQFQNSPQSNFEKIKEFIRNTP